MAQCFQLSNKNDDLTSGKKSRQRPTSAAPIIGR